MDYLSMDAFAELPPGTQFFHRSMNDRGEVRYQTYVKLCPNGGDIGSCSLVEIYTGLVVHAVELWDMHEIKLEDNPGADPENCVDNYAWEYELVSVTGSNTFPMALFHAQEMDQINAQFLEAADEDKCFITFAGILNSEKVTFSNLEDALEHFGIDLPSEYDEDEQERLFEDYRRHMDDQNQDYENN